MGAPHHRLQPPLSNEPIRVHSNIYEPDYVVVVDETLLDSVDVTAGLETGGRYRHQLRQKTPPSCAPS